jgi:hypothetical protein
MKREILKAGLFLGLAGLVTTGCVSHRHHHEVALATAPSPAGEIIVTQAPPEPRTEVITVAPSSEHVWVRGYWMSRNGRWVWMPGHYERRPRAGVAWVQGHWDRTPAGWTWRQGHWE